jgi:hypothetical protein
VGRLVNPSLLLITSFPSSPTDVLCGRGSSANNHIGNIRFRDVVKNFEGRYRSACKADKPLMALQIVLMWKALDPPGRFLAKPSGNDSDKDEPWCEVSEATATKKVAQRLRERSSSFAASQERRRERHENSSSGQHGTIPESSLSSSSSSIMSDTNLHAITTTTREEVDPFHPWLDACHQSDASESSTWEVDSFNQLTADCPQSDTVVSYHQEVNSFNPLAAWPPSDANESYVGGGSNLFYSDEMAIIGDDERSATRNEQIAMSIPTAATLLDEITF